MSSAISPDSTSATLRERVVQTVRDGETSPGLGDGEDIPQSEGKLEKEKKTFGRTPNGTSNTISICELV